MQLSSVLYVAAYAVLVADVAAATDAAGINSLRSITTMSTITGESLAKSKTLSASHLNIIMLTLLQ